MRYMGKILDPKDLTTKEYVDAALPVYEGQQGEVLGFIQDNVVGAMDLQLDKKADKVTSATNGDFAGLDANGNLTDSGKSAVDFATAAQGAKADTAIQTPASPVTGQYLKKTADGWETSAVDALPSQEGQSGKYLTTNGTAASWADVPQELYWCTYGTTTSAQINTALSSNQFPVCKYEGVTYNYYGIASNRHVFTAIGQTASKVLLCKTSDSTWSSTSATFEKTSNKVTAFQATPDNTHYPSEKLVKDSLDAKQDSLPTVTNDRYLHTNSSTGALEWSEVDALPSQEGQEGKYLTTNGSVASWGTIDLSSKADVAAPELTTKVESEVTLYPRAVTIGGTSTPDTTDNSENIATTKWVQNLLNKVVGYDVDPSSGTLSVSPLDTIANNQLTLVSNAATIEHVAGDEYAFNIVV